MKNLLLTVIISCVGINIVIASPKVKLKLISYNIRFLHAKDCGMHAWEARKEASVNMIRREHPDARFSGARTATDRIPHKMPT